MFKFGLEREYFVVKDGEVILPPGDLPVDEGGLLVEARGNPAKTVREAVFNLLAEEFRIQQSIKDRDISLSWQDSHTFSREQVILARRDHIKGTVDYQNLYGHDHHNVGREATTAGLHISFTKEKKMRIEEETVSYNAMFDFATLFRNLDEEFQTEIEEANRNPGFYEIKRDGRIEYRSLPTSLDLRESIGRIRDCVRASN